LHGVHVVAGPRFAAGDATQEVDDAIGESLAGELELLDHHDRRDVERGLLPHLTDDGSLDGLARLDLASWKRPGADCRGMRAPDEKDGAVTLTQNHRADRERRHETTLARVDLSRLALDDAWLDCLDEVAAATGLDVPRIADEVRALSEAYNSGAFARARTKGALAARLAFFFGRDLPKSGAAVRELLAHRKLAMPEGRALRVLDIGTGLGASTWGLARALSVTGAEGTVAATFVDEDEAALRIARVLADARRAEGAVKVEVDDVRAGVYDVVLVGQSLGEMIPNGHEDEQARFLGGLIDRSLAPDGSLVVIEPALRERTRRLHRVRDLLVARGGVTVFAPCLHARPCPALADESAWCHEDLPIDLPPRLATLARAAGLRWQGLTFSYLVLRKDGATLRDAIGAAHSYRVVSLPIVTKGKRELWLCADGVRRKLARLDRDRPAARATDAWANAERGDVLVLDEEPAKEATRLTRGVGVRRAT
jgi:SAM-dependent methyltransferase